MRGDLGAQRAAELECQEGLDNPGAGVIGLHRAEDPVVVVDAPDNPVGGNRVVGLGFETTHDLESVAARPVAAGYDARVVDEHGLRAIHVTDPDGQHLEIHPHGPDCGGRTWPGRVAPSRGLTPRPPVVPRTGG